MEVIYQEWNNQSFGSCDVVGSKMYINSRSSKGQQESTLLHEIIEHINSSGDLQMNHSQISILESMLYQVLKDNKLFFE